MSFPLVKGSLLAATSQSGQTGSRGDCRRDGNDSMKCCYRVPHGDTASASVYVAMKLERRKQRNPWGETAQAQTPLGPSRGATGPSPPPAPAPAARGSHEAGVHGGLAPAGPQPPAPGRPHRRAERGAGRSRPPPGRLAGGTATAERLRNSATGELGFLWQFRNTSWKHLPLVCLK